MKGLGRAADDGGCEGGVRGSHQLNCFIFYSLVIVVASDLARTLGNGI
jgi:hypothetical protein